MQLQSSELPKINENFTLASVEIVRNTGAKSGASGAFSWHPRFPNFCLVTWNLLRSYLSCDGSRLHLRVTV